MRGKPGDAGETRDGGDGLPNRDGRKSSALRSRLRHRTDPLLCSVEVVCIRLFCTAHASTVGFGSGSASAPSLKGYSGEATVSDSRITRAYIQ